MSKQDISKILEDFEKNIYADKNHNTLAWDLCYNYFNSFVKSNKVKEIASGANIENSCIRLGIYLANYKMYRDGKGHYLSNKNYQFYKPLITAFSNCDIKYWKIDVDKYDDDDFNNLIKLSEIIDINLGSSISEKTSITLKTKILMGVFGNMPAFDGNVCEGFLSYKKDKKPDELLKVDLEKVKTFYNENQKVIDEWSKKLKTITFEECGNGYHYTKARIVDIVAFQSTLVNQYWSKIFTTETWGSFLSNNSSLSFSKSVAKVNKGDYLVCYLNDVSKFVGILEVEDNSEPKKLKVKKIDAVEINKAVQPLKASKLKTKIWKNSLKKINKNEAEKITNALKEGK